MKIEKNLTLEEHLKSLFKEDDCLYGDLKKSLKLCDVTGRRFSEELYGKKILIWYNTTRFLIFTLIKTIGVAKQICILRAGEQGSALRERFQAEITISEESEIRAVRRNENSRAPIISTDVLLYTSGTTGEPKLVTRTFESLTSSVKTRLSEQGIVWGLCYDPEKFAGLQVVLQALLSGSTLCGIDDYRKIIFSDLLQVFGLFRCNAISATPSFWRILLGFDRLKELEIDYITMGGEIVNQDILDKAVQIFPRAKIAHIYASTELGVGFSVNDRKAGFSSAYLDSEALTAKLKIIAGELYIKSGRVGRYVEGVEEMAAYNGYLATGDLVEFSQDKSRVFFLGRKNKSMNIGGTKVMPEEIERIAEAMSDVQQSRSYSMPHRLLGNIIILDYIRDGESKLSSEEIKKNIRLACRSELGRAKVPAKINEVENIELSGSGKVVR